MSYSVILSDGKSLSGLEVSSDYFVSKAEVRAEDFEGRLARIEVVDDGGEVVSEAAPLEVGEHEDMELFNLFKTDGQWYFCLRERDKSEAESLRDRADIEYIAMMTGVEL